MNDPFISRFEKRSLSLKVDPALHQAIRFYCLENDKTIQEVMEGMLREFVEENDLIRPKTSVKKKVSKK